MHLMPLNCTPKNGYNGKFCYVYFTTIKKKKTNPQRENKGEETSNRILKARNQTD